MQNVKRDLLPFAYFLFAGIVLSLAAWEKPSPSLWLSALHNLTLAFVYVRRRALQAGVDLRLYRRTLLAGLVAAFLPVPFVSQVDPHSLFLDGLALSGYALVLWSLLSLRGRFAIGAADRGVSVRGPYRWVRHPLYLGELLLRFALLAHSLPGLLVWGASVGIQVYRALLEEKLFFRTPSDSARAYGLYAARTRYRLIPFIF